MKNEEEIEKTITDEEQKKLMQVAVDDSLVSSKMNWF
jgi:hypothetical protein